MPFKSLPFLTARELRALIESCTRTPEGCLLYEGPHDRPGLYFVRGEFHVAARLMWAEHYATTAVNLDLLNTHEVQHIAECPHPAHDYGPRCIEPTHLQLGLHGQCRSRANERKQLYGGVK